METTIYYFTSTGNSLETARLIGQKLGNTTIVSIPSIVNSEEIVCTTERIGFVFPVYMFGLPLIVKRFVEKLRTANKNAYIFATATCGGNLGIALSQIQTILQKNGLDLTAGFMVKMPGNYTPLYSGPEHKTLVKLIAAAGNKTNQIANQIIKQEKVMAKGSALFRILGRLMHKNIAKEIPIMSKKFTVRNTCKSCGICERVCPTKNIHLQNGKPNWLQRCEHCLACLQWCPNNAIQWGNKTAGRRRYHHPAINIRDIEQAAKL